MMTKSFLRCVTLCALFGVSTGWLRAQMVDPAIDRDDEPFCYYSEPTDVIGVMDGKEGTLVTPEGYLYTGFGELMFFTGNPSLPLHQRVKTLVDHWYPVIQYTYKRDSVFYHVTMFAATLDGNPESPLMNFIRVGIENRSSQPRTAWFSAATRYQNDENTDWQVGDNRFGRPAKAEILGQYTQAGVEFNKEWEYGFDGDAFVRDGKVFYLFPTDPQPTQLLTFKTGYNEPPAITTQKMEILPTTPVGIVRYRLPLDPGKDRVLEFRMPYEPLNTSSPEVARLRSARFDEELARTKKFWDRIVAQGMDIALPEPKVVNTFRACLVYSLIARNKEDGFYIQKVNEFQYDSFWLRDASWFVRMYDVTGYADIARQCLEFFGRWQQPDGNFVSQGGQFDGWGQTLWAYGQHYRMTRDRKFADTIYPSVVRAVGWLRQARRDDTLHLMPVTTPGDNENISGHVSGHNFLALGGLKNAIALAQGLGKVDDVAAFTKEYDDFDAALRQRLKELTARTGGYIPPGLDTLGGQDWGNLESVSPEPVLDPFDPMVTATLATTRAKYAEGLMTYGDGRWLHHYVGLPSTETEVIRGEQELVLEDLYAFLLHTSATHAPFEFSIFPWGTRDFGMNLSPHGWAAAKYRILLRNMLVREQGNELHLLSCLSPEWLRSGSTIGVRRAPTEFGQVNFDLAISIGTATLRLDSRFTNAPAAVILHTPWFMDVSAVKADGRNIKPGGKGIRLPSGVKKVEIVWSEKSPRPTMSYLNAVENYKKEYRRRYEEYLIHGTAVERK